MVERSTAEILDQIRRTAPPRQERLDTATRARLAELTCALLAARPDSVAEFDNYLRVRDRVMTTPASIAAEVDGRTVAVTGGSGCVGTALVARLVALRPARVLSLANTPPRCRVPGVEYVDLDIRLPEAVQRCFDRYRPAIVFHLAAQRDPGLAERRVAETIGTNLMGTGIVAAAAERAGVGRLVYASTGKAVRPYTSDVYAGSKRIGEWVMASLAARGRMPCSGVRFTHVVDNSIILDRLLRWCAGRDVVRLHSAETLFYVQSAAESAQLLLTALLAPADQVFRMHVIRDLGWPVSLLDLALGAMIRANARLPLYLAGHEPGYEEAPYPGLYDPASAGDVSPLLNAFEARHARVHSCPAVDTFPIPAFPAPEVAARLPELYHHCRRSADADARAVFEEVAWQLLIAMAQATDPVSLRRVVELTGNHRTAMSEEHLRIDDVFHRWAAPAEAPRHPTHRREVEPATARPA